MNLIVGLGNPGKEYEYTRHNAGYLFIEKLQKDFQTSDLVIKKTDVFMNDSGSFVKKVFEYYKVNPNNLYIIHDDLDIPLGEYKIQQGTGPKDHNGINNIEQTINTKDFWRIRIGVDNREVGNRVPGEAYVLQKFNNEELKLLGEVFNKTIKELKNKLQNDRQ